MAKKNVTVSASANTPAINVPAVSGKVIESGEIAGVTTTNKSELIRQYHAANPTVGPSDIAKALSTDSMKISPALVGQVINGRGNSNGKAKGLDVNTIKAAAAFVKSYEGDIDEAEAAIQAVGKFVEDCGGVELALAALTTFKEISSALA